MVYATFSRPADATDALKRGVTTLSDGATVPMKPLESKFKRLRITGLLSHISDEKLLYKLQDYGEQIQIKRCTFPKDYEVKYLQNIENGMRVATMVVKNHIPNTLNLDDCPFGVKYEGQPTTCNYCKGLGHFIRECPKLICKTCNAKGHTASRCTAQVCQNCKVVGHFYDKCPFACSMCGEAHTLDECEMEVVVESDGDSEEEDDNVPANQDDVSDSDSIKTVKEGTSQEEPFQWADATDSNEWNANVTSSHVSEIDFPSLSSTTQPTSDPTGAPEKAPAHNDDTPRPDYNNKTSSQTKVKNRHKKKLKEKQDKEKEVSSQKEQQPSAVNALKVPEEPCAPVDLSDVPSAQSTGDDRLSAMAPEPFTSSERKEVSSVSQETTVVVTQNTDSDTDVSEFTDLCENIAAIDDSFKNAELRRSSRISSKRNISPAADVIPLGSLKKSKNKPAPEEESSEEPEGSDIEID